MNFRYASSVDNSNLPLAWCATDRGSSTSMPPAVCTCHQENDQDTEAKENSYVQKKTEKKREEAHTALQATNEMPFDLPRQQLRLLQQLLGIVLAEVLLLGGALIQGQDIRRRLQLRHGDETHLSRGSAAVSLSLHGIVRPWIERRGEKREQMRYSNDGDHVRDRNLQKRARTVRPWAAWVMRSDTPWRAAIRDLARAGSIFMSLLMLRGEGRGGSMDLDSVDLEGCYYWDGWTRRER
jgi:hypothetical protein